MKGPGFTASNKIIIIVVIIILSSFSATETIIEAICEVGGYQFIDFSGRSPSVERLIII